MSPCLDLPLMRNSNKVQTLVSGSVIAAGNSLATNRRLAPRRSQQRASSF